jgi:hypothetical protein
VHVSERDDGRGNAVKCEEASVEFFVSHEQLAEAVEPTVADLYHTSARLLRWVELLCFSLLATTDDVGDVAGVELRNGMLVRPGHDERQLDVAPVHQNQ